MDFEIDECTACLGDKCCADIRACSDDPSCTAAFEEYRICATAPGADVSACFTDFGMATAGTSGPDGGGGASAGITPLGLCILSQCHACGVPPIF
jgi:hypothetical protein